jgi:hypothetical protein
LHDVRDMFHYYLLLHQIQERYVVGRPMCLETTYDLFARIFYIPHLGENSLLKTAWNYKAKLKKKKKTSVVLVRRRTIPTERPQPVGELSANFS